MGTSKEMYIYILQVVGEMYWRCRSMQCIYAVITLNKTEQAVQSYAAAQDYSYYNVENAICNLLLTDVTKAIPNNVYIENT